MRWRDDSEGEDSLDVDGDDEADDDREKRKERRRRGGKGPLYF